MNFNIYKPSNHNLVEYYDVVSDTSWVRGYVKLCFEKEETEEVITRKLLCRELKQFYAKQPTVHLLHRWEIIPLKHYIV